MITLRIIILFSLCTLGIITVIGDVKGQSAEAVLNNHLENMESIVNGDRVTTERRFSVLETKMDMIKASQDSSETVRWIELLMLSGLLGERGIQIAKNKLNK